MFIRASLTILMLIGYGFFHWIYSDNLRAVAQAQAVPSQLLNSNSVAAGSQFFVRYDVVTIIVTAVSLIMLALLWLPVIWKKVQDKQTLKTSKYLFFLGGFSVFLLTACKPYGATQIIEIKPNETAFVVPLVGDATTQLQFQSIEFLEGKQVASKQVEISMREHRIGRLPWQIEWIPSVAVIIVDRTPVTREWTSANDTGTSISNQAFRVESRESIDFAVGATCSALVEEQNAAKFLYYFSGKSLPEVIDENIRGFVQAELFNEFGSRTLEQGRADKREIFENVYARTKAQFEPLGITITSLGGSEGLIYSDKNVQAVINDNFASQQRKVQAEAYATAQSIENMTLVDQAQAAATATVVAGNAAAENLRASGEQLSQYPALTDYELAQRSQGLVPNTLVISGGEGSLPFAFLMNSEVDNAPVATIEATPQPTVVIEPTPTIEPTATAVSPTATP